MYRTGVLICLLFLMTINCTMAAFSTEVEILNTSFVIASHFATNTTVSPRVILEQKWAIKELIQNGRFEKGLEGWSKAGPVDVAQVSVGESVARLGAQDQAQALGQLWLKQEIREGPAFISFNYKTESLEELQGFDEPCFVVITNQEVMYQDFCDKTQNGVWQSAVIDVRKWYQQPLNLTFFAGNTADLQGNLVVELTHVSSAVLVAREVNDISVECGDQSQGDCLWQLNSQGGPKTGTWSFLQTQVPELEKAIISYRAPAGSELLTVMLVLDKDPPASIQELRIVTNFDSSYSLVWPSPEKNVRYQLWGGASPDVLLPLEVSLAETTWFPDAAMANNGWRAAKVAGVEELYDLSPSLRQTLSYPLYLALTSVDAAGHQSALSNVVEVR